jgi:hypothetical protein
MIYQELSKSQKKIARMLIDKSLEQECSNWIEKTKSLLNTNRQGTKSSHELYLEIYKSIHQFDKHLAKRYNNLGGSAYFAAVLGLYIDDVLSDDDLADFDEDIQNKLAGLKTMFTEQN